MRSQIEKHDLILLIALLMAVALGGVGYALGGWYGPAAVAVMITIIWWAQATE